MKAKLLAPPGSMSAAIQSLRKLGFTPKDICGMSITVAGGERNRCGVCDEPIPADWPHGACSDCILCECPRCSIARKR